MIIGNILKFGYGDIDVSSNALSQRIGFQQFKPHAECGENLKGEEIEYIGNAIVFNLTYDIYCKFSEKLNCVLNKEITEFTFENYIFDFNKYNTRSIKTCIKALDYAMHWYFMARAC